MLTGQADPEAKRTAFGALWALKIKPKKKESEIILEQKAATDTSTLGKNSILKLTFQKLNVSYNTILNKKLCAL